MDLSIPGKSDRATGLQETIERLEERLRLAMLKGDTSALEELLSDQLVFIDQNGRYLGKEEDLSLHRSKALLLDQLDVFTQNITVHDNTAIVTNRAKIAGSFSGTPFTGTFAYTRIWISKNERWQVVSGHCSPSVLD